jgi:paraquat-inducible protein A
MTQTQTSLPAHDTERECLDCGLLQRMPRLPANGEANCLRCDATLRRSRSDSLNKSMAFSVTAFVLYAVAITQPFLNVDIVGRHRSTTMLSLPGAFWNEGSWILALIVSLTAILAPIAKISVMLSVLIGLRLAEPPAILPQVFKWYRRIGPWAMVEVFLLGVFVAFTRLRALATVDVGVALYAVAALMIVMVLADYYLDPDDVWEAMETRGLVPAPKASSPGGQAIGCTVCGRFNRGTQEGARCTRCATRLYVRMPHSMVNTTAFVVASIALYIPANIYPILTLIRFGRGQASTILGGAQELLEAGMWPLALLVFVASIMVPVLKLLSLAVMLVTTRRGSAWHLQDRTSLFRLVDFVGRWSMIDVFMLATLVGLVQAGAIASIVPGLGAICFGSVVVLTMIAVSCFDPRQMWDAAGTKAPVDRLYPLDPSFTSPSPNQDRPIAGPAQPRIV